MIPASTEVQVINLTWSWASPVSSLASRPGHVGVQFGFHLGEAGFHLGEPGVEFGFQPGHVGFGGEVFAFMVVDGLGNALGLGAG